MHKKKTPTHDMELTASHARWRLNQVLLLFQGGVYT